MALRGAFPALRRGAFGVLQGIHIAHGARMAGMHSMRRYWIAAGYIDSERVAISKSYTGGHICEYRAPVLPEPELSAAVAQLVEAAPFAHECHHLIAAPVQIGYTASPNADNMSYILFMQDALAKA